MKKISIILFDLGGGGAERLHIYLANDWAKRGILVELVVLRKKGELLSLVDEGVVVTGLDVDRIRHAFLPLAAHIRKSKPVVTLVAMWPLTSVSIIAWLIAGKLGRIFTIDHTPPSVTRVEELKVSLLFLKSLMRITYPIADGLIAVSQGVKGDLCQLGNFSKEKVRVIYNPATTGVSTKREIFDVRTNLWGSGFKHHILSVGTLKVQKDHETLIKAFALLPSELNAKLVILGEGQLRIQLSQLVDKLGLQNRVELPGFVLDPADWYRSADLFAYSSRWDGLPLVLIEALEFGLPIVSTDCPSGPAEILQNGLYGKLVPVQDPKALAYAIEQGLNEDHDSSALMMRAQDFSLKKISDEYLDYMFPNGYQDELV